jgi:predicted Fe-Mo cluster-binding NifX family protein
LNVAVRGFLALEKAIEGVFSMKIAIPVWEDKVSPVLDTASRLMVVDLKEKGPMSRLEIYLDERDLARRCLRIQDLCVDTLICGAVTRHFSEMLKASGIKLIQGISGQPEAVLNAYLDGTLAHSKYSMPGSNMAEFHEPPKAMESKKFFEEKTKINKDS